MPMSMPVSTTTSPGNARVVTGSLLTVTTLYHRMTPSQPPVVRPVAERSDERIEGQTFDLHGPRAHRAVRS